MKCEVRVIPIWSKKEILEINVFNGNKSKINKFCHPERLIPPTMIFTKSKWGPIFCKAVRHPLKTSCAKFQTIAMKHLGKAIRMPNTEWYRYVEDISRCRSTLTARRLGTRKNLHIPNSIQFRWKKCGESSRKA